MIYDAFNSSISISFYTAPTIDGNGNAFFAGDNGIYRWSPATNEVTGVRISFIL
jgi:hypothetical protein